MQINAEVTPAARDYLSAVLAKREVPGMAARMYVEKGGTPDAETCLVFCPPGEESSSDIRQDYGDLTLYLDVLSAPYLQDMEIGLHGEGTYQTLTIKAPNSKKPAKPPKTFKLSRDCEALRVPYGTPFTLPEGAEVTITQALGGSFTVKHEGNLYRLSPEITRQLGLQADVVMFEPPEDGLISEAQCQDSLRLVYDPEIPVNIVSLGLVYKLDIDQQKKAVTVRMTLTSPGCGMGDVIAGDVRNKILQVPHVQDCQVDIVFDPPWSYDNLGDEARLELGLI
jgi:probable FeS assembly SUF system protein SufT